MSKVLRIRAAGVPIGNHLPALWFRADGGPKMGYGHLVRSVRLGKKVSRWARVSYVVGDPAAGARVRELTCGTGEVLDQEEANWLLSSNPPRCLITDMPRLEEGTRQFVRRARWAGARVASIHDLGLGQYESDLAIDASAALLRPFSDQRHLFGLFRGPRYAVLSDRCRRLHEQPKHYPDRARRLLITLGGGDARPVLEPLLPALCRLTDVLEISIAAGIHPGAAEWMCHRLPSRIRRLCIPPGEELAGLLHAADLVLVAGGLTLYEAACVGTPALVVSHHRLQQVTGRAFAALRAAVNLGVAGSVSADGFRQAVLELVRDRAQREALGSRARSLVDGWGSVRVDWLMRRLSGDSICGGRFLWNP